MIAKELSANSTTYEQKQTIEETVARLFDPFFVKVGEFNAANAVKHQRLYRKSPTNFQSNFTLIDFADMDAIFNTTLGKVSRTERVGL